MSSGYPTAAAGGIDEALADYTGFTFAGGVFTKEGTTSGCSVTYNASSGGAFPVVDIASTGC
jgi:hypothetical protein